MTSDVKYYLVKTCTTIKRCIWNQSISGTRVLPWTRGDSRSAETVESMFNAVVMLYNAHTICVTLGVKDAALLSPWRWSQAGRGRGSGAAVTHILTTSLETCEVSLLMASWGLAERTALLDCRLASPCAAKLKHKHHRSLKWIPSLSNCVGVFFFFVESSVGVVFEQKQCDDFSELLND